jgi:hypothetical protein
MSQRARVVFRMQAVDQALVQFLFNQTAHKIQPRLVDEPAKLVPSDMQIITGAEFARVRKCLSLSRRTVSSVSSFSTCSLPRWPSSTTDSGTRTITE